MSRVRPVGPLVLAMDTATPQVSVALAGPGGILATVAVAGGRRHGELLAPMIAEVCRLSEVALDQVTAVAVDVGPGLFTGLRVGVATARALVAALGVPGIGLTSLEALAGAQHRQSRGVVAVVDARRSEVFWARFRPGPAGLVQVTPAAVAGPDELVADLTALDEPLLVVGDGARRYHQALAAVPAVELAGAEDAHPHAAVVARLALARLDPAAPRPTSERGDDLDPLYLRQPEVRIGWTSRDEPAPVLAAPSPEPQRTRGG